MGDRQHYRRQVVPLTLLILDLEQRRPTRKEIVDAMIAEATFGRFMGDKRDGEAPPITIQSFTNETIIRYAAKAYRARLSRLPRAELLTEALAAADFIKAQREQIAHSGELVERLEREEAARMHSERQAELGSRPRLQLAILTAARHYRQIAKKSAKDAWQAIKRKPYEIADGSVVIETAKGGKEEMLVRSRRGQQKRSGIGFGTWQERYWPKAEHGN